jgi:hypothetical protein
MKSHPIFDAYIMLIGNDFTPKEARERLLAAFPSYGDGFIEAILDTMGDVEKAERMMLSRELNESRASDTMTVELTNEQLGLPPITENAKIMNALFREAAARPKSTT